MTTFVTCPKCQKKTLPIRRPGEFHIIECEACYTSFRSEVNGDLNEADEHGFAVGVPLEAPDAPIEVVVPEEDPTITEPEPRLVVKKPLVLKEHNVEITVRWLNGEGYTSISRTERVSTARVQQIIGRVCSQWVEMGVLVFDAFRVPEGVLLDDSTVV